MHRVYSIHSSALQKLTEWISPFATCSALGFEAILLTLESRNIFDDRIAAALDFSKLIALASDRSLQIVIDVPVATVQAGLPEAAMLGLSQGSITFRDPRIAPVERQSLHIPLFDEAKARTWLDALRRRHADLTKLGVAGFCCRPGRETQPWIWPVLTGRNGQSKSTRAVLPVWARLTHLDPISDLSEAGFTGAFLPAISLFETKQLALLTRAGQIFNRIILSLD